MSAAAEVRVHRLAPDDWRLWREVRLDALADAPEAYGSSLEREKAFSEADWRDRMESTPVLVTVDDESVAIGGGFLIRPGTLLIVAMWTRPSHRGHGYARLVLDELFGHARAERLQVELDVTVGNESARRAYEKYGFVATGETEPLRGGSEMLMERMTLTS